MGEGREVNSEQRKSRRNEVSGRSYLGKKEEYFDFYALLATRFSLRTPLTSR